MVNFLRIILIFVICNISLIANAENKPVINYQGWNPYDTTEVTDWFVDSQSACVASAALAAGLSSGFAYQSSSGHSCVIANSRTGAAFNISLNTRQSCPSGTDLSGTQCIPQCPSNSVYVDSVIGCTCFAGYEKVGDQCKPVNPCPEGQEEQGGACVPKKCKPEEIRVNGFCVPEPPCPEGETRVNGKCEPSKCPKSGTFAGEYKVSSSSSSSFCESSCTISIRNFVEAVKDGKVVDRVGMGFHTGNSCNGPSNPPGDNPGGGGNNEGGGNNNGGGGTGGNTGGGTGGNTGGGTGGNTGGGTGGNTGGGGGGGGNPDKPPEKCTKPGGCTGTDGGTNNGGNSGSGSGTNTEGDGTCPAGKYKSGGKCYDKEQPEKDPDDDGACLKGYAKVNGKCVPYKPSEDEEDDKPGTFGGACGAGFACEGDVIQCSIAKEQHVRNCKLFDEKSAESLLYEQEKDKKGDVTKDLPGNETISMTGRIDTSDVFGGGGSGVQDLNLTVAGRSVTLQLSVLNEPLRALGLLLVSISFLIAFRIVGRG